MLKDDNWDTNSNKTVAKIYNFLRPAKGKKVKINYTGDGHVREFYIPLKSGKMIEITDVNKKDFDFLGDVLRK